MLSAHEYHGPPAKSRIFTRLAELGVSVKLTKLMFVGFAVSRPYETFETVYPLIACDPWPAVVLGTVFEAVRRTPRPRR